MYINSNRLIKHHTALFCMCWFLLVLNGSSGFLSLSQIFLKTVYVHPGLFGSFHCFTGSHWFFWSLSDLYKESRVKLLSPSAIPQHLRAFSRADPGGGSPAAFLLQSHSPDPPPRCHNAAVWPDLATAGLNSSKTENADLTDSWTVRVEEPVWPDMQKESFLSDRAVITPEESVFMCTYSK